HGRSDGAAGRAGVGQGHHVGTPGIHRARRRHCRAGQRHPRGAMIARLVATVLGVGHLRPAPGTWGSLVALPLAYGLLLAGGWVLLVLAIVVAFGAGVWATAQETRGRDNHDPSEIVID